MDCTFSRTSDAGGTLHLPSPTHAHNYRDGFSSINKIRRSLSYSPSKSRFPVNSAKSPPISPLAISRAFSSSSTPPKEVNTSLLASVSHLTEQQHPATGKKGKPVIRRTAALRSSPRINATSRSPVRRALGETSNQGNVTPSASRRTSEEPLESRGAIHQTHTKTPSTRLDFNDGPIKFEFARPKPDTLATTVEKFPVKSSPLKRSDGVFNVDSGSFGSPVAKRRSVHSAIINSELDVFTQANVDGANERENPRNPFASPISRKMTDSPLRKTMSLRKSTLHQRQAAGLSKSRASHDDSGDVGSCSSPFTKSQHLLTPDRASSDLTLNSEELQSPFFRSSSGVMSTQPIVPQRQTLLQNSNVVPHQPHPLSNTIIPSSASGLADDIQVKSSPNSEESNFDANSSRPQFSRSLPIGSSRPVVISDGQSSESSSFATPDAYKMAKPLPAAFMSTGLISKRNRNIDFPAEGQFAAYAMPDTPSKRVSFPPMTATPGPKSVFVRPPRLQPEFGTPSTPFGSHSQKPTPIMLGRSSNIFTAPTNKHSLTRKASFVSVDGDENANSPSGNHDSQSSVDELPPTPTKPTCATTKPKENSLRSSLFGRRGSLGPDTFVPPNSADVPSPKLFRKTTPTNTQEDSGRTSPHTPQESFTPTDHGNLSISVGQHRQNTPSFNSSTSFNSAFPPATPTAPRDHVFPYGPSLPVVGVTNNDVDTSLTARFAVVHSHGVGEFSQVYRVEKPIHSLLSHSSPRSPGKTTVWAVKKTKKPYSGNKDRERKLREVEILRELRNNDHIINFVDFWESKGHLYIQTEFCEDGNLKDFLTQTGYKGRLDDFRIWKIMLELSLGVKHIHDNGFIHLDLKPANIFIDFEGILKIGDFGLATSWPAPPHIEGEGDREYIAPEVLHGRLDKPADIFALGMIMLEIAGNIILPDQGSSWQRLRHGDLSDLPSLTWSSESTLPRDESGDIITSGFNNRQNENIFGSDDENNIGLLRRAANQVRRSHELVNPPRFMIESEDDGALDKVVEWMISENPDKRPVIEQVYQFQGIQWVQQRRRSGATIYEGNWGPSDDVLNHVQDVDMTDV